METGILNGENMRKIKVLFWALLLAASTNWISILQGIAFPKGMAVLFVLAAMIFFFLMNIIPYYGKRKEEEVAGKRLKQLQKGRYLILYTGLTSMVNLMANIALGRKLTFSSAGSIILFVVGILVWLLSEGILLLNGCIRLFATSMQMGIRYRVALFFLWWVPVLNLFFFYKLYQLAGQEYEIELEKMELNAVRKENECCHTRYPILMVHGVFFRDARFFNYWGRIPKELMRNGAEVYYGNQQSAATVAMSGMELADRIKQIVQETGCGKVNVIAHSKGGLDIRYAISNGGVADYVASLTTINTPHRGCMFADFLLEKAPEGLRHFLAEKYNGALRKLGDASPDFLGAVTDLTAARCMELNREMPDCNQVYYQSVASSMPKAHSGRFPLNFSYYLVKYFDGENDGLVSIESALWGNVYCVLRATGKRGISHGDLIDLNRENFANFDTREFYVNLVRDLKEKGF